MKAILLSLSVCMLAGAAFAGPQQEKMKTCNADAKAKDLSGDERKNFMKACLSAKSEKATNQQDKMKTCNADAKTKELKGDDRKKFMKECLAA
jgi:psiF repeat